MNGGLVNSFFKNKSTKILGSFHLFSSSFQISFGEGIVNKNVLNIKRDSVVEIGHHKSMAYKPNFNFVFRPVDINLLSSTPEFFSSCFVY
jgi:hypothetical protein